MTTEAYVNVVMAESIAAGLLETCCSFRLSDLGRSVCLPRACMRANPPARALCREVCGWMGLPVLRQDFFVMGFAELLARGEGVFERPAGELARRSYAMQMREAARYAGIGPATLLHLLAVEFKEESRKRGDLIQEGDLVRMPGPDAPGEAG